MMKSTSAALLLLLAAFASTDAFSPAKPTFALSSVRSAAPALYSADGLGDDVDKPATAKPLEVATDVDVPEATASPAVEKSEVKMLAKNLNTGEIKELSFNDPSMIANSNPFQLGIFGWFFVLYPTIVISNDFLHFMPKDALNIWTYIN